MKKWTKQFCSVFLCLVLMLTLFSAGEIQAAGKVKLNRTTLTITQGDTRKLTVSGTTKKITWSSSNKKVAKVSSKGVVTGVKTGKATITAKYGKKKLKCKVTVKSKETYVSPKTGKKFTMPDAGFASITYDGEEKTVPAQNEPHTPDQWYAYDNYFQVYLDGKSDSFKKVYMYYALTKDDSWKTGKTLSLSELQSEGNKISVDGIYSDWSVNAVFSNLSPKFFKDAQFTIIEMNSSTGLMKWYFYVEISDGSSSHTFEGVAHTIRGEKAGSLSDTTDNKKDDTDSSSDDSSSDITPVKPGPRTCGVCMGKGKVKCSSCTGGFQFCHSCNGLGKYYSSATGTYKVCTTCHGGGKVRCTRCNGTGYKKCNSCNGTGKK